MILVTTHVSLQGKNMGVHPVAWKAALSNDLPGRFSAGDSVPMRTGTIHWGAELHGYDGETGLMPDPSPLEKSYPAPGDRVEVWAKVVADGEAKTYKVFTGTIESTTGGMDEPLVSEIIDDSDKLASPVAWYSLASRMPRRANTLWHAPRPGSYVGFVLAEAARQCGFGAEYPEHRGGYIINTHLNGSMWSDYLSGGARLIIAGKDTEATEQPYFASVESGEAGLAEGAAGWDKGDSPMVAHNGLWVDLEIIGARAETWLRAGVRFSTSSRLLLAIDNGQVRISTKPGELLTVAPLGEGNRLVGVFYPAQVGENLWVRINKDFYKTTLTRTDPTNTLTSPSVAKMTYEGSPIFLAKQGRGLVRDLVMGAMHGEQATASVWEAIMRSRTENRAKYRIGDIPTVGYLPGSDHISGKAAIAAVAEPFCISSWVDGRGTLQFATGKALREQKAELALTEADFTSITWEKKLLHQCSKITVTGKAVDISIKSTGDPIHVVHEGGSETFEASDTITEWISLDGDTDFFEIDTAVKNLNDIYDAWKNGDTESGRNWRGWWGLYSVFAVAKTDVVEDEPGKTPRDAIPGGRIFCKIDQITPRTFKLTTGYRRDYFSHSKPQMPKEIKEVMRLNDDASAMPVIRAGGKVSIYQAPPIRVETGGPAGPELTHDMGVFQGEGGTYMAALLADYFGKEHPVFSDVGTVFDPRIEVGTVVNMDCSKRWGHRFQALVTSVSHDPVAGTTTFTPRVLFSTRVNRTYEDVAAGFATLGQLGKAGDYTDIHIINP